MRERREGVWDFLRRRWLLFVLSGCLLALLFVWLPGVSSFWDLVSHLKPSAAAPTPARRVITIPPPAGGLPGGFPQGSVTGGAPPPPAGTYQAPTPTIEIGPAPGAAAAAGSFRDTDLSVFIYAVNAPGTIRVNGQEFKTIKAEPNMQYNINTFGQHFRPGENTIDFDVVPTPGDGRSLSPNIHMKVSHKGSILGEWRLSDTNGWPRSVTVVVPGGESP